MIAPIPKDIPDLPAIPGIPPLMPSVVPASAVVARARRPLAAAFRLLVALAATTGVTIDLILGSPARVLSYFTVQSNILVALVFTLAAARAWSARRPLPPLVTGGTLLFIVTTGLVYHLILASASSPFSMTGEVATLTGWPALANQILHTAVPIAALLDWLLLTSPPPLALRHAPVWLLYPLAYLAFSLARGELLPSGTTARYLYPFLDVDQHGYKGVLGNALLLGLAIYALSLLLITLDHIRPDPIRRRAKTGFRLRPPVG